MLTLEIQGCVWGTPPDDVARSALADIEKCIGVDRHWSFTDPDSLIVTKLALDTRLITDKINVVHLDLRYAVVTKTVQAIFRTASFNPYSQT